jgi:hypothetical protein
LTGKVFLLSFVYHMITWEIGNAATLDQIIYIYSLSLKNEVETYV